MKKTALILAAVAFTVLLPAWGEAPAPAPAPAPSAAELATVIERASANIMARRIDGTYWNMPSYLGTNFISLYYCLTRWFGKEQSLVDPARLREMLIATQLPDGSWINVRDAGRDTGTIDFTIFNYFALKAMGTDPASDVMRRARAYITARGGIEKSALFTRIWLALFRNYPWERLPSVPFILFNKKFIVNYTSFSQWVTPHLVPIAYLRRYGISRDLGPAFSLAELWVGEAPRIDERRVERRFKDLEPLVTMIMASQQPRGSWGGYTMSSLLSIMVLQDAAAHFPQYREAVEPMVAKSFNYIEELYFKSGDSAYRGVLDDGRYWDTALLAQALTSAGMDGAALRTTADYLLAQQQRDGGFPFGEDFWYAPDIDDTAEIVIALRQMGARGEGVDRAVRWLAEMQNRDGGWGAFDKNNTGNFLIRFIARGFMDSVDLFDESCPDITGHILEALAAVGQNVSTSPTCRRGVAYLKKTQDRSGAWEARWGINYLYGTGAAVVGLVKVGEDPRAPYLRRAVDWLLSCQNADGGWGESSRSYDDRSHAGKGMSTPTQTAWVLLALIEAGHAATPAAARGARYLVDSFYADGRWIDRSVVGTGHPKILYMDYPSYPYAFPLIALSRYRRALYGGGELEARAGGRR